jgi:uncharacterized protein
VGWGPAVLQGVRAVLVAGGIVVAAALALKIAVMLMEPRLTFFPVRGYPATPQALGLPFEEVTLRAEDGVSVHGWFFPGGRRGAESAPLTLLFFHGNAENIGGCLDLTDLTRETGDNLLLVDYHGYGESGGQPSETGLYLDGRAALAYLKTRRDVDPGRIVLWGRSIGSAVAVELATAADLEARPPKGVILESPFTSVRDLLKAGGHWIFYAASRFGTYRFDSVSRIGRLRAPLLVIHGTADDIVPLSLGREMFDRAAGKKEFVAVEGGGHNDLWALHEDSMRGAVERFLSSIR